MNSKILFLFLIFQIFSFSFNQDEGAFLQISRSMSHNDQTGSLTPLVVKLSSVDKAEKIRNVSLICVVDVSGSMNSYNRMNLVRESLTYLVNMMTAEDKLAIVAFSTKASTRLSLMEMNEENKVKAINAINGLKPGGGTRILEGLKEGLKQIEDVYSSGEKVVSMILLSDGEDRTRNIDTSFKDYINSQGKQNIPFTLHTLGYGDEHDANLMNKISLIRDGGYFFIRYLSSVNSAILNIYGSLSTNFKVNVELNITSNFVISNVMGKEDMYQSNLISSKPSSFTTKIIQMVYGKNYDFIVLVDIPENTEKGVEVLKAKVSQLNLEVSYFWENSEEPYAYE